jgi:subtilase family serine protease
MSLTLNHQTTVSDPLKSTVSATDQTIDFILSSFTLGKWWTTEQILDLIAPSIEEVKPVVAWLKSHGVEQIDVSGRDFIKVVAPIHTVERMFSTKMYNYRSLETGKE